MSTTPNPAAASAAPGAPLPSAPPGVPEEFPLTPELLEDEAIRGDLVLRWLVVLMAFLFGLTQIVETPALVHVKTGQYLLQHGILPPAKDVFSYTAAERPWINLSWGFDLLVGALYSIGGWVAVSLLKPLLAVVAFGLAVHTAKPKLPTWWSAFCMALAVLACHKKLVSQPSCVTLLGLAVVMWQMDRWRRGLEAGVKVALWPLVPVFLVWANLDPRMFLGLAVLVLWGVGDLLGSLFGIRTTATGEHRRKYWLTVAAAAGATLVHPFLWKSTLSPLWVYGAEYPANRSYIDMLAGGIGTEVAWQQAYQPYFSLWQIPLTAYDPAVWCAIALVVLAFVTIALNYFREVGHILMLAGMAALGGLATNELPAAAFVAAVIAGLNGQAWFASQFSLDYRINFWNVAWSRGGRAVTVLLIAVAAFFGGTGILRSTQVGRTGIGLDPSLDSNLTSLAEQLKDSYDDRPFNMSLFQGDQLVWLNQRVFADSRAAVYGPSAGEKDGAHDLLAEYLQTRFALSGKQAAESADKIKSPPLDWKKTFDAYQITHVVPRLSGDSPDYSLVMRLSLTQPFQPTSIGGATLILYRTDLKDEKYQEYLAKHPLDFLKQAYQAPVKTIEPRGELFATPPDFYSRYFWSRRRHVPIEIQEALHLVRLSSVSQPMGDAMALLGIRKAHEGLNKDSDCAEGYLALGMGYATLLNHWDGPHLRIDIRRPASIRYYQAVAALNQALVADPDNPEPHYLLVDLYLGPAYRQARAQEGAARPEIALRPDLALREARAAHAALNRFPVPTEETRAMLDQTAALIKDLEGFLEQVAQKLASERKVSPDQQAEVVLKLASVGCFDSAAKMISEDPDPAANPNFRRIRPIILWEVGDVSTAYRLFQEFEDPSISGEPELARYAAASKTVLADYPTAAGLAEQDASQLEYKNSMAVLESLKLRPVGGHPWPVAGMFASRSRLFEPTDDMADRWLDAALYHVEAGNYDRAESCFRTILEVCPNASTPLRALIYKYLSRLGRELDVTPVPEGDQIPALHEEET